MTVTRVTQAVACEVEFDMHADQYDGPEPADRSIENVEMNEFTINGVDYDPNSLTAFWAKRGYSDAGFRAACVWAFMEAIGDAEASKRREWE
jgi:hypothetical protein